MSCLAREGLIKMEDWKEFHMDVKDSYVILFTLFSIGPEQDSEFDVK